MEENNVKNKQSNRMMAGIVIGLLIALVVGMGAYIVFDKVIDKHKNDEKNTEVSKIKYNVSNEKLYVNDKESEIENALEYNVKGQIDNVLIVSASYLDSDITYALDKDGKIVFTFKGKGNVIREDASIEGNSVIITSDNLAQDPEVAVCNLDDANVVVYKEKFKYANGKFESPVLLSSETAKEYKNKNNIKCTLTQEVKIDLSKCLNGDGKNYSNPIESVSSPLGLTIQINSDNKSAVLTIGWSIFGELVGETNANEIKKYNITGFTKNIESTFIGETGQDIHGTKLVYLMEDGTVEYTSLFVKKTDASGNTWYDMNFESQAFKSNGAVSGVSDIVKLYNADGLDGRTVLAVKKDGSYYDIGKIINK